MIKMWSVVEAPAENDGVREANYDDCSLATCSKRDHTSLGSGRSLIIEGGSTGPVAGSSLVTDSGGNLVVGGGT